MKTAFYLLVLVCMAGLTPFTAAAQECGSKNSTLSVKADVVQEGDKLPKIKFELGNNKTFNQLQGPSRSSRNLIKALQVAKTFDGKPLVQPGTEIWIGKSRAEFTIGQDLKVWETQRLLAEVLNQELLPCGKGIKWKGGFEHVDPTDSSSAKATDHRR